jgi:sialate O-acetylesterase
MNVFRFLPWGLVFLPMLAGAELRLARPFGDHMVLPGGDQTPVWGEAAPGETVTVRFGGQTARAEADGAGKWKVFLAKLEAESVGRELVVSAGDERVILRDVLVGEVWLCSGQSNMDFPLERAIGGRDEAKAADDFPAIRLLDLGGVHTAARAYGAAERARLSPEAYFHGGWQRATEVSALGFSAVGWWAGRVMYERGNIPIGLIDNSVGGSGAEAWLPREILESWQGYADLLDERWLESARVSAWARGRAKLNLGGHGGDHPFRPGFLYEAGVAWWRGFPLTGVLWYQGETNAEIDDEVWNERLLRDLVGGWRAGLERVDLPFFMVQLPRIGGSDPLRRHWPRFREVQARVAADLPHVTLIQTTDLGWDSPDVHPPDKRPVGERLGEAASVRFLK